MSCTYLAHHELESVLIIILIIEADHDEQMATRPSLVRAPIVCCQPVSQADAFVVCCCLFHEGTRQVATTAAGFSDSFAPFEISP